MNANMQLWIDALRSGEFEQAIGFLRHDEGYCCLGVASELYMRAHPSKARWAADAEYSGAYKFVTITPAGETTQDADTLPPVVAAWLGVGEANPTVHYSDETTLAELNDTGVRFDRIADVIEGQVNVIEAQLA